MPKRRRIDDDIQNSKRPHLANHATVLRRSSRIAQKNKDTNYSTHLLSPAATQERPRKRKPAADIPKVQKRRRTQPHGDNQYKDWVEYWVLEGTLPPQDFFTRMGSNNSRKRPRSESNSTRMEDRYEKLEENGISMQDTQKMTPAGKQLCDELTKGDRAPKGFPVYPPEHWKAVLRRAAVASEAIIQRDLLPILVPSVANLHLLNLECFKDAELDCFLEEIHTEWKKPSRMGGKHPKPDYVVGLRSNAFDDDAWNALTRYEKADNPVLVSAGMCFPLLVAEVKRATVGISMALLQATHAAAIAVKSQIHLFRAAYGESHSNVQEMYGYPLVFSVCHTHDDVQLLAHYALLENSDLKYYHSVLKGIRLTGNSGKYRNKSNTFVENVYRICGPAHLKRLREAAKALGEKQLNTGDSFGASQLHLQDEQIPEESVFKKPSLPESARTAQELEKMRKLLEEQTAGFEAWKEEMNKLLDESRKREEEERENVHKLQAQVNDLIQILKTKNT